MKVCKWDVCIGFIIWSSFSPHYGAERQDLGDGSNLVKVFQRDSKTTLQSMIHGHLMSIYDNWTVIKACIVAIC